MSYEPPQSPAVVAERCEVVSIERLTATIAELWLAPAQPFLHLPGQYVVLEGPPRQAPPRSYSIGNTARADGLISLLVRLVPDGQTSKWVHQCLKQGADVEISGPYGTFLDDVELAGPRLFLAAGSGLAPIRALTEAALAANRETADTITLMFSARTEDDVIDRERFERWEGEHPRFRFVRTLTQQDGSPPRGRIPVLLASLFPDLREHHVYVAGSAGFVAACSDAVKALRTPCTQVHSEPFFVEPQPWPAQPPTARGAP